MSRRDDNRELLSDLDRFFVEAPRGECAREEAVEAAELSRRIAGDDGARARFDRLAHADRALGGDPHTPGVFERGFGEAAFLGALDAMLEAEQGAPGGAGESSGAEVVSLDARRRTRAVAAIAAVAAGLAVAGGLWQLSGSPGGPLAPKDDFQARSAATLDGPEAGDVTGAGPRVEVYCVSRAPSGELRFTGPDQAAFGVVRCGLDDELKLAIAGAPDDRRFAHLVGVADDGTLYWYGPSPADDRPHELRPAPGARADAPVPVGESLRLAINHRPGPIRVHAVMTRTPMDHQAFATFVEARRQGATQATIDVTGTGFVAFSRVFEVVEEKR